MAADHADIRVPPECRETIRAGALLAISTSGGKDSQAMTILLSRIVPRDQLVAVHAPLGKVEWEGDHSADRGNASPRRAADLRTCHLRKIPARSRRGARKIPRNPPKMVHGVS